MCSITDDSWQYPKDEDFLSALKKSCWENVEKALENLDISIWAEVHDAVKQLKKMVDLSTYSPHPNL